jgi:hypothetical protein
LGGCITSFWIDLCFEGVFFLYVICVFVRDVFDWRILTRVFVGISLGVGGGFLVVL